MIKASQKALLAVVAVALTVGYLWQTHRVVAPRQATWDDIQAAAAAGGYRIVSTEELAGWHSKDLSSLLLVDTRQEWEYRSGHIEGAFNFPMEPTWWARWRKAGALAALLGPDKDQTVVFY